MCCVNLACLHHPVPTAPPPTHTHHHHPVPTAPPPCLPYVVTVMVLVGNKTDLAEQREVAEEEARAFADR